jgi:hypothetical protein
VRVAGQADCGSRRGSGRGSGRGSRRGSGRGARVGARVTRGSGRVYESRVDLVQKHAGSFTGAWRRVEHFPASIFLVELRLDETNPWMSLEK